MGHSSVFVLNQHPSVASVFVAELRNTERQDDRLRFRRNTERVGELLAYELSKTLDYTTQSIRTPLDTISVRTLAKQPVLVSVLRAGIPLHQGVLNYFDQANSGFIGAFRQPTEGDSFTIEADYHAVPPIDSETVVLIDPMLATGQTIVQAMRMLHQHGTPAQLHVVAAIASSEGVAYVQAEYPNCALWLGAVDPHLNQKSYIVPGLGDAGDLAFGPKI